jgi:hypothetical protein
VASDVVAAAAIAGGVSIVVAAGTVIVTQLTTRATIRRDHQRQEDEFRRRMTERLYDRRVAVYPGLFAASDAFRRSKLRTAGDLPAHLRAGIAEVDAWFAKEGGLLLSPGAHGALVALRHAVRSCLDQHRHAGEADAAIADIWRRKNELRRALRVDLGLLFAEVENEDRVEADDW